MQKENNKFPYISLVVAAIAAGTAGLVIHIGLLSRIDGIVAKVMQGVAVAQPPYSAWINFWAFVSALLPAFGMALIYYFISCRLPAKTKFTKGVMFWALLSLAKGVLIREPLMDYLVGNPLYVVILQHGQIWASNLATSLIIAYIVPSKDRNHNRC